jgi:mono/diheme cytochrome c family protein
VLLLAVAGAISVVAYIKMTGLSARATPGSVETAVARRLRALAIPGPDVNRRNPIPRDDQSVRNGMAHFADHCASCHANNGSGDTELGRNLFPPAPDMRRAATQDLSDGALFYIIEHGIRFTGMPAWGTGAAGDQETSWHLVNFIRHLPKLTSEQVQQMEEMNPRPPAEIRQEIEEERFLAGEERRKDVPADSENPPGEQR